MKARSGTALSVDRPFPGLRPFEFADRAFFFGRRRHVLEIYRLLDLSRFIAVIGSSGSGKSSLVRAGLLPLLEDEKTWKTVTLHPGDHPLVELTEAFSDLAARVEEDDDETHREIRRRRIELALGRSSFGISAALGEMPKLADASVLLLVDQFEELFRYAGLGAGEKQRVEDTLSRDEAAFFVQSLLEATRSADRQICVLITMRSDFIGDCARYNGLPEAVSAAQFLVPSLTRDQREEVIREPIVKAGATIEPELVERLLNDIGPELDQLPVLSHCLARLWSRAKERHLTLQAYASVGGIDGALSKHANDVLASRTLAGLEDGVELVFRALSERDKEGRATRRALLFERLLAETGLQREQLVRILDRFRSEDCSFIVPSTSAVPMLRDDTRIDVVHEALLRRWSKISAQDTGWLAREEADGRFYRGLLAMLEGVSLAATVTLPLDQVEERWERWTSRPRTAAWAERYGGSFERVEQLLNDSRLALTQSREAESRRIEAEETQRRERLVLETKLAQEQANAARLLAQRTRLLAAVMSVIAVLALGAAMTAIVLGARSRVAEAKARVSEQGARREAAIAQTALKSLVVAQGVAVARARSARSAARRANEQAAIARRESAVARRSEAKASTIAARESNVEHSLSLVDMDYGMYQAGVDNRVAGLFGADAYASDSAGGSRDILLTAAWTPYAIGRVALPPWTLGAVTNRGRDVAVLAGVRQQRYGELVTGSLVTVDAANLAVLGRLPNVRGSLMCGFDDSSRVAIASAGAIAWYDVSAHPLQVARLHSGSVSALGCLPDGRVAYVDDAGSLRIGEPGGSHIVARVNGEADGIVLSHSGRIAAVTMRGGDVAIYSLPTGRLLSKRRFFTQGDDCSPIAGCAGALAMTPDEKMIAWYDAGSLHVGPVASSADSAYACPVEICASAALLYFARGASMPYVVAKGGTLYYDGQTKAYAVEYDDHAGAQRLPIADPEFNMYVTPYDPARAEQPNPYGSGIALQSFSRIDGPMLGTIPDSQWTGSYGLHGHDLLMATRSGYAQFNLRQFRRAFQRTYDVSYHVHMFDCGDGEHAIAFNMVTGEVRVLDIRSATPVTLDRFMVSRVPVKNGYYQYFVLPAYDPRANVVTILSHAASFATLKRYSARGRLLNVVERAQLLRAARVSPASIVNWNLSDRGNYVFIKVREPAPDVIVRWNGALVGKAFSIDYVSPDERRAIATSGVSGDYREVAFSLPDWKAGAFLGIPTTVQQLASSPDGRTVAYWSADGNGNATLHLYDWATHETYPAALPNPPDLGRYDSLAFSADGHYLLASYDDQAKDHRLAVYAVDPAIWARSACLMAGRSLTATEFRQYVGPGFPYRDGCLPYAAQMYRW